jgi:hypothetical protein
MAAYTELSIEVFSPDKLQGDRFSQEVTLLLEPNSLHASFHQTQTDQIFRWIVTSPTAPDDRLEGSVLDPHQALRQISAWLEENDKLHAEEESIVLQRLTDLGYL